MLIYLDGTPVDLVDNLNRVVIWLGVKVAMGHGPKGIEILLAEHVQHLKEAIRVASANVVELVDLGRADCSTGLL